MKLNFGEILRKYRRERDLTQEELAQDIGISSQSVSKWERNDGYPDIELLPVIARYFGVTIDALLGNDRADEAVFEDYMGEYSKITDAKDYEGKINVALEYYRKYSKSSRIDDYASNIVFFINRLLESNNSPEMHEKYVPLLKEICERNISQSTRWFIRRESIEAMCLNCNDDEFDKWYDMCAGKYGDVKYEILEKRLWRQQKYDESRLRYDVNNLNIMLHFIGRENRNWAAPERAAEYFKEQIRLLEYFGDNGNVPQAWWGRYANWHFRAGCASIGYGALEEGYKYIDKAFELFPRWFEIPDGTPLELGRKSLFGGVKAVKGESKILLPDGTEENLTGEGRNDFRLYAAFMYKAMTREQGWEWFDSVRGEDLFKEYVEKARLLMEKYTPAE